MLVIGLTKRRNVALGIRFHMEPGDGGAEVESVEPYGLAWRLGLKWGDVISLVRIVATNTEHPVKDGQDAASALRPAVGRIELRVLPRACSARHVAAACIQSHVLGGFVRDTLRLRASAATHIQASWRRWCAVMDARALRLDAEEDRAAELIQGSWRRHIRQWERQLAVEYLQEHCRKFVAALRTGHRARKRQRIRAPPVLLDDI